MTSITLKVKKIDEVRRFTFDCNGVPQYEALEQKVRTIFKVPAKDCVHLTWKDEDGDFITISSDCELNDSLQNKQQNILVLYLKTVDPEKTDTNAVEHVGIICNICHASPIQGTRFKCVTCSDYDICSSCFHSNHHTEHDMVAMRKPGNSSFFRPQGCRKGRFGGFPGGHWFPFQTRWGTDSAQNSKCEYAEKQPASGPAGQEPSMCSVKSNPVEDDMMKVTPVTSMIDYDEEEHLAQIVRNSCSMGEDGFVVLGREDQSISPCDSQCQNQCVNQSSESPLYPSIPNESSNPQPHSTTAEEAPLSSFAPQDLPEHVSKSLKWMQGMGFHNEGGWLSALLLEHNGDINKIMEIMDASAQGDFSSMRNCDQ